VRLRLKDLMKVNFFLRNIEKVFSCQYNSMHFRSFLRFPFFLRDFDDVFRSVVLGGFNWSKGAICRPVDGSGRR